MNMCCVSVGLLEPTKLDLGEVWALLLPFLALAHHAILSFQSGCPVSEVFVILPTNSLLSSTILGTWV